MAAGTDLYEVVAAIWRRVTGTAGTSRVDERSFRTRLCTVSPSAGRGGHGAVHSPAHAAHSFGATRGNDRNGGPVRPRPFAAVASGGRVPVRRCGGPRPVRRGVRAVTSTGDEDRSPDDQRDERPAAATGTQDKD
ncbi:hypothetical protein GCM10023238_37730 [Streptomyces heliomycini]